MDKEKFEFTISTFDNGNIVASFTNGNGASYMGVSEESEGEAILGACNMLIHREKRLATAKRLAEKALQGQMIPLAE